MPIRLSGIASNMDTDAIIKELMNAQSLKKTKIDNKITKLQWTKDIWKDMNSKIYKFYTGPLSKLKTQGSFSTKKATSSNESKVTVKAGAGAPTGSHSISDIKLASAQYVTSEKLGDNVTGDTKIKDLMPGKPGEETVIKITTKSGKSTELYITNETTMNDLATACSSVGLNASFDNTQKRFFISSKESGAANAFEITAKSVTSPPERESIRNLIGYHNSNVSGATRAQMDKAIDDYVRLLDKADNTPEDTKLFQEAKEKLVSYRANNTSEELRIAYETDTSLPAGIKSKAAIQTEIEEKYKDVTDPDPKVIQAEIDSAIAAEKEKYVKHYYDDYKSATPDSANPYLVKEKELIDTELPILKKINITSSDSTTSLESIGLGAKAKVEAATNSQVNYNGAVIEGTTNQITVNGVTFELHGETVAGEKVSLTISNDIDSVYNMVKDFVKGYNELLLEMNTLYNATSSKGYNPLTDEEKSAMTDDQIEKWEQKIKDSLLRRDDKLSGVMSSMRNNMSGSVVVNGKTLSLSSFGIVTGAYTEKGILHIQGDVDDATYSGDTDKLKKALTENPDEVVQVLTKLAGNLYADITDKMKSTSLSSALTIYNDKEMDKTESRYKKDLATLEKKLKEMENRYYKQFSAMETAMSKLNSQSSQLSSMLGL